MLILQLTPRQKEMWFLRWGNRTEPHEEVKEGKKIVSVENVGDYECYIRVKAYAGNKL